MLGVGAGVGAGDFFAAAIAATMSLNSGFNEAPPTRKPSTSGMAESSGAFFALAEPPYWMRIASAHLQRHATPHIEPPVHRNARSARPISHRHKT